MSGDIVGTLQIMSKAIKAQQAAIDRMADEATVDRGRISRLTERLDWLVPRCESVAEEVCCINSKLKQLTERVTELESHVAVTGGVVLTRLDALEGVAYGPKDGRTIGLGGK